MPPRENIPPVDSKTMTCTLPLTEVNDEERNTRLSALWNEVSISAIYQSQPIYVLISSKPGNSLSSNRSRARNGTQLSVKRGLISSTLKERVSLEHESLR